MLQQAVLMEVLMFMTQHKAIKPSISFSMEVSHNQDLINKPVLNSSRLFRNSST
jgi:hypothetical protein